jgi:hypothetical protein
MPSGNRAIKSAGDGGSKAIQSLMDGQQQQMLHDAANSEEQQLRRLKAKSVRQAERSYAEGGRAMSPYHREAMSGSLEDFDAPYLKQNRPPSNPGDSDMGWRHNISVTDQGIPDYDAMADQHCKYTGSQVFKASPYAQVHGLSVVDGLTDSKGAHLDELQAINAQLEGRITEQDRNQRPLYDPLEMNSEIDPLWRSRPPKLPGKLSGGIEEFRPNADKEEAQVQQRVEKRERIVEQIRRSGNKKSSEKVMAQVYLLRVASVEVVEAVVNWRKSIAKKDKKLARVPFLYNRQNYLLKMILDLDFFGETHAIVSSFQPGCHFERNPFTMPSNLEQMLDPVGQAEFAQEKQLEKGLSSSRVMGAAKVLAREDYWNKRGMLRASPVVSQQVARSASPGAYAAHLQGLGLMDGRSEQGQFGHQMAGVQQHSGQGGDIHGPNAVMAQQGAGGGGGGVGGAMLLSGEPVQLPMISTRDLGSAWAMQSAPPSLTLIAAAVRVVLGPVREVVALDKANQLDAWADVKAALGSPAQLVLSFRSFKPQLPLARQQVDLLKPLLLQPHFHQELGPSHATFVELRQWVLRVVNAQQNNRSFVDVNAGGLSAMDGSVIGDGYDAEPEGGDDEEEDIYDPKQDIVMAIKEELASLRMVVEQQAQQQALQQQMMQQASRFVPGSVPSVALPTSPARAPAPPLEAGPQKSAEAGLEQESEWQMQHGQGAMIRGPMVSTLPSSKVTEETVLWRKEVQVALPKVRKASVDASASEGADDEEVGQEGPEESTRTVSVTVCPGLTSEQRRMVRDAQRAATNASYTDERTEGGAGSLGGAMAGPADMGVEGAAVESLVIQVMDMEHERPSKVTLGVLFCKKLFERTPAELVTMAPARRDELFERMVDPEQSRTKSMQLSFVPPQCQKLQIIFERNLYQGVHNLDAPVIVTEDQLAAAEAAGMAPPATSAITRMDVTVMQHLESDAVTIIAQDKSGKAPKESPRGGRGGRGGAGAGPMMLHLGGRELQTLTLNCCGLLECSWMAREELARWLATRLELAEDPAERAIRERRAALNKKSGPKRGGQTKVEQAPKLQLGMNRALPMPQTLSVRDTRGLIRGGRSATGVSNPVYGEGGVPVMVRAELHGADGNLIIRAEPGGEAAEVMEKAMAMAKEANKLEQEEGARKKLEEEKTRKQEEEAKKRTAQEEAEDLAAGIGGTEKTQGGEEQVEAEVAVVATPVVDVTETDDVPPPPPPAELVIALDEIKALCSWDLAQRSSFLPPSITGFDGASEGSVGSTSSVASNTQITDELMSRIRLQELSPDQLRRMAAQPKPKGGASSSSAPPPPVCPWKITFDRTVFKSTCKVKIAHKQGPGNRMAMTASGVADSSVMMLELQFSLVEGLTEGRRRGMLVEGRMVQAVSANGNERWLAESISEGPGYGNNNNAPPKSQGKKGKKKAKQVQMEDADVYREFFEDGFLPPQPLEEGDAYEVVGAGFPAPFTKNLSEKEVAELLQLAISAGATPADRDQNEVSRLLLPENRMELCEKLVDAHSFKIVPASSEGDLGGISKLETVLHRQTYMLTVSVNSQHKSCVIGSVDIDDFTSLAQLRQIICAELDPDDYPDDGDFRMQYKGTACSSRQEARKLAVKCLPVCVILSSEHMAKQKKAAAAVANADIRTTRDQDMGLLGPDGFASYRGPGSPQRGRTPPPGRGAAGGVSWADQGMRLGHATTDEEGYGSGRGRRGQEMGVSGKKRNWASSGDEGTSDGDWDSDEGYSTEGDTLSASEGGGTKKKKGKDKDGKKKHKGKKGGRKKGKIPSYLQGTSSSKQPRVKEETAMDEGEQKIKAPPPPPQEIKLPLPGTCRTTQGMTIIETTIDLSVLAAPSKVEPGSKLCIAGEDNYSIVDAIEGHMITLEQPYEGLDDDHSLLAKVIFENEDTRPAWLREYAAGRVEQTWDHTESEDKERNFGVPVPHAALEELVALGEEEEKSEKPKLHMRRVDYFPMLPPTVIVKETFELLCTWYPAADLIEGSKFAKFAREFKLVGGRVKGSDIDLAFSKCKQPGERRIDLEGFDKSLHFIACLKYKSRINRPDGDAQQLTEATALLQMEVEYLSMFPDVNSALWKRAKLLAMKDEAKQQCGAIAIQSVMRMYTDKMDYQMTIAAATAIQARFRTYYARCMYLKVLAKLAKEGHFRYLTISATILQTAYRRFFFLSRFLEWQEEREEARRAADFERWKMLHDRRLAREARLVFKEGRRINGTLIVVSIYKSAGQRDHGIEVLAYVPLACEKFKFDVTEAQLREMLHQAINVTDVALSELYISDHLTLVADRLLYRWCRGRQIIKLSRRGNGERGQMVARRGLVIGGERYVVDVYDYNGDLVLKTYDTNDCSIMRASVTAKVLRTWVKREDGVEREKRRRLRNNARSLANAKGDWMKCMDIQNDQEADDDSASEDPVLLSKKGFEMLLDWLIARLYIRDAHQVLGTKWAGKKGKVLMLQYEVEEQMINSMACKIQGVWRSRKAMLMMRAMLKEIYSKRWDNDMQQFYYVNVKTQQVSWSKPLLLGSDDVDDPPDKWIKMTDEYGNVFYLHPLTGRTSWMSELQAATKMQRLWRKRAASEFRIDDIGTIIKALRFQQEAKVRTLEVCAHSLTSSLSPASAHIIRLLTSSLPLFLSSSLPLFLSLFPLSVSSLCFLSLFPPRRTSTLSSPSASHPSLTTRSCSTPSSMTTSVPARSTSALSRWHLTTRS